MSPNSFREVIERHLFALNEKENHVNVCKQIVAIAYDNSSINNLYKILDEIGYLNDRKRIVLTEGDNSELSFTNEYPVEQTIVFLTDYDLIHLLEAHRRSFSIKNLGIVVVSCFTRSLFYNNPTNAANIAGLTYEGIFTRVAHLLGGDKRGDYFEFGVFDGRSMSLAYHTLKGVVGKFYGFDSFAGIIGRSEQETKLYSDGMYYSNLETFLHNMKAANVDLDRIVSIKGNILDDRHMQDTKEKYQISSTRAAVIHIDCDVYKPAKRALDYCKDMIMQGSVLLFDEFHSNHASNQMGERRALREWLDENPQIEVERWHDYAAVSRAYIVHVSE